MIPSFIGRRLCESCARLKKNENLVAFAKRLGIIWTEALGYAPIAVKFSCMHHVTKCPAILPSVMMLLSTFVNQWRISGYDRGIVGTLPSSNINSSFCSEKSYTSIKPQNAWCTVPQGVHKSSRNSC